MMAPRRRGVLHWVRNCAFIVLLSYVVLFLFVQGSERVMRHRTERLLAEMRGLTVDKSTWADLQRIRTQWGRWGSYEGTCTETHCDYAVHLVDIPGEGRVPVTISSLGFGHSASADLQINVDGGVVRESWFRLALFVPKGYGTRFERPRPLVHGYTPLSTAPYLLYGIATSRPEIGHLCCYWPQPLPHPDYELIQPGGCFDCAAIWTEFVPGATTAEKMFATNFNLSCITRWKPCADEEDLLPGVGIARQREAIEPQQPCADYSIETLSHAALNAAVVRIEGVTKSNDPRDSPTAKLKLVRRLGGTAVWPEDGIALMDILSDDPLLPQAFRERKPLIILYPEALREGHLEAYGCGLLPYSRENEKAVVLGVSAGVGLPDSN